MQLLNYIRRIGKEHGYKIAVFGCKNDLNKCYEILCNDVFDFMSATVYEYCIEGEDNYSAFRDMNLVIVAVTDMLLDTDNIVRERIQTIQNYNILILPIMVETVDRLKYKRTFKNLQYLNREKPDYSIQLNRYLNTYFIENEEFDNIDKVFRKNIFLSYRKSDYTLARKLIHDMHTSKSLMDVGVWCDDLLIPGKDYEDKIKKEIENSDYFLLLVTDRILERNNYVLKVEYEKALSSNKRIVPIELEQTDHKDLYTIYKNLPYVYDGLSQKNLASVVEKALDIHTPFETNNCRINYYLALAYFYGIKCEKNIECCLSLLEKNAAARHIESLNFLRQIYQNGIEVQKDYSQSLKWAMQLVNNLELENSKEQVNRFLDWYEEIRKVIIDSGSDYDKLLFFSKVSTAERLKFQEDKQERHAYNIISATIKMIESLICLHNYQKAENQLYSVTDLFWHLSKLQINNYQNSIIYSDLINNMKRLEKAGVDITRIENNIQNINLSLTVDNSKSEYQRYIYLVKIAESQADYHTKVEYLKKCAEISLSSDEINNYDTLYEYREIAITHYCDLGEAELAEMFFIKAHEQFLCYYNEKLKKEDKITLLENEGLNLVFYRFLKDEEGDISEAMNLYKEALKCYETLSSFGIVKNYYKEVVDISRKIANICNSEGDEKGFIMYMENATKYAKTISRYFNDNTESISVLEGLRNHYYKKNTIKYETIVDKLNRIYDDKIENDIIVNVDTARKKLENLYFQAFSCEKDEVEIANSFFNTAESIINKLEITDKERAELKFDLFYNKTEYYLKNYGELVYEHIQNALNQTRIIGDYKNEGLFTKYTVMLRYIITYFGLHKKEELVLQYSWEYVNEIRKIYRDNQFSGINVYINRIELILSVLNEYGMVVYSNEFIRNGVEFVERCTNNYSSFVKKIRN